MAPIILIALFSTLNITFMVYNLKATNNMLVSGLQPGDTVPEFVTQNINRTFSNTDIAATKGVLINFISPGCPYCQDQLPILESVAAQYAGGPYRFINISPALPPELIQQAPTAEWFEDQKGQLRELFKVSGYPTLFVIRTDGKIMQVIPGVPQDLKSILISSIKP
jgi:thiol-disulfide isomerase/thioredoxin